MGGSSAPVAPTESAAGLAEVLTGLDRAQSGRLINYQGEVLAW